MDPFVDTPEAAQRALDRAQEEIRLVHIEPLAPGADSSGPIKLRLDHHPLKDTHWTQEWKTYLSELGRPYESNDRFHWRKGTRGSELARYEWGDYFALSYTWGSHEENHEVIINGESYLIRQNLEASLRALRDHHKLPSKFYLWIDALCINQRDVAERGLEVERMSHIYSKAIDTLVWLGSGDDDVAAAIQFLHNNEEMWQNSQHLADHLTKSLEDTNTSIWLSLVRLSDLNYWKRQWVLQEIAAGTDGMPFVYGKTATNWTPLWKTIWYFKVPRHDEIGRACSSTIDKFPEHKLELNKTLANEFFLVEHASYTQNILRGPKTPNTSEIFTYTRPNGCSNPRDKVYGLLGVMNPALSRRIKPNYGADVDQVYNSFAKDWIEVEDLDILGQCDDQCSPSWVPRFNVNYPWYRHLYSAIEPAYNAHGGRTKTATVSGDRLRLLTDAVLVDQIDGMSTSLLSIDFKGENALQPERAKQVFQPTNDSNAYGSLEALQEAIWRSSGGNRDLEGQIPAPEGYSMLLTSFAMQDRRFSDWVSENTQFRIAGRPLTEYIVSLDTPKPSDAKHFAAADASNAVERFTRFAWSRRLATTKTGLVGFVPQQTQPGDWMVVMPGCSFPVLMRQVSKDSDHVFRAIMPCYMHGIMAGEVWRGVDEGTRRRSKITIV